jgi:hypothetical protein
MKKIIATLTVLALSFSSIQLNAQEDAGTGARQSTLLASSGMSWGVGLIALASLGTMAGLIASSATKSPVTFSHN